MSGEGKTSDAGFAGQQSPTDTFGDFNVLSFLISQAISLIVTSKPVQVKAVSTSDEVGPVGFVDVQPMINQIDGLGKSQPHGTVYHLPYFRLQGGTNGIICDPKVGDIGLAVISDRDASSVKESRKVSNPGSFRKYDMADGFYLGGFLNQTLVQYLRFYSDGIEIIDKNANAIKMTSAGVEIDDTNGNKVLMTASGVEIDDNVNGNTIVMDASGVTINGVLIDRSHNVSNAGTVQATGEGMFNGHTVGHHIHSDPQGGNTGLPTG